jgi:hypothetical protein
LQRLFSIPAPRHGTLPSPRAEIHQLPLREPLPIRASVGRPGCRAIPVQSRRTSGCDPAVHLHQPWLRQKESEPSLSAKPDLLPVWFSDQLGIKDERTPLSGSATRSSSWPATASVPGLRSGERRGLRGRTACRVGYETEINPPDFGGARPQRYSQPGICRVDHHQEGSRGRLGEPGSRSCNTPDSEAGPLCRDHQPGQNPDS